MSDGRAPGSIKTTARLPVELWAGLGEHADVLAWAENEIAAGGQFQSAAYDLLEADAGRVGSLLEEINKARGFSVLSRAGKRIAVELVQDRCRGYLESRVSQEELCEVANFFESNFLGVVVGPVTVGETEGGGWLGGLYDACDWIEASTDPAGALREAAQAMCSKELLPE
jgi:hypothetical protein